MKKWTLYFTVSLLAVGAWRLAAVEIPLESLTPARIGYIDLQKVFDTYPEKAFAEGDLLKAIEKRKRDMGQRQTLITTLRQQIAADQATLKDGQSGSAVIVPANSVPDQTPVPVVAPPPPVAASTSTVSGSSAAAVAPYPLEDPLAGLPGHDASTIVERVQNGPAATLPGMKPEASKKGSLLDQMATGTPVTLNPDAIAALQRRIDDNKRILERKIAEFRMFRTNALADMKVLQNQKTYDVMSKIYAVMQTLARDEGVSVVLDKAYVLYGEDTIDLSDKLIARLNQTDNQ